MTIPPKAARICLVTSQSLYGSPRTVKEADALADAGYRVRVVAGRECPVKAKFDADLIASRQWQCQFVDWGRASNPGLFWKSRFRQHLAKRVLSRITLDGGVAELAVGRITSELTQAAAREPADLLIGHNLPALPAVVRAAQRLKCRAGFDAEDYHSGMWLHRSGRGREDDVLLFLERRFMPACDYLTAASPMIAERYQAQLGIEEIGCILNTFPLSKQPASQPEATPGPLTLYWFSQTIGQDRGLEPVVEAMGRVSGVPIELHLRGEWQPGYREQLFRKARECCVAEPQIVAHQPDSPDEMIQLASKYHVGLALEHPVSINRDICLTNKVFNYMLAGNALVMTRTAAHNRLAQEMGDGAFLFDPDDSAALAAQLEEWHQNRAALNGARDRSWELGRTRYNWDYEQKNFLEGVAKALGNPRRSPGRC